MTSEVLNEIIWDINTYEDIRMGGRGMHKKGLSENVILDNWENISKEDLLKILSVFDYAIKSTFDSFDSDEAYQKIIDELENVYDYLN